MEILKIKSGETVKLDVKISSDANVGSNVSLDDQVIRKSITNHFNLELGNIDDLDGKVLSIVSNFFAQAVPIDNVMETTHVDITISSETTSIRLEAEKVKLNTVLFMAYEVLTFKLFSE